MYYKKYDCLGDVYSKYTKPQKWSSAIKESVIEVVTLAILIAGAPIVIYGAYMLAFAYQHGCNFF